MKIKEQIKVLAAALSGATKKKKGKQLEEIVERFMIYSREKGLMPLIPAILDELKKIHYKQNGIVLATILSRYKLELNEVKKISKIIKDRVGGEIEVENSLEPLIMGGMTVKYEDKIIDMSIKESLNSLKNKLIN